MVGDIADSIHLQNKNIELIMVIGDHAIVFRTTVTPFVHIKLVPTVLDQNSWLDPHFDKERTLPPPSHTYPCRITRARGSDQILILIVSYR